MSGSEGEFTIHFENLSTAEAGIKASRLRQEILDAAPDVQVRIAREDPASQDFGTTLVLILGAPAAVAIAKGIADYLRRDRASLTIKADGSVVAQNITGDDAVRLAEALPARRR